MNAERLRTEVSKLALRLVTSSEKRQAANFAGKFRRHEFALEDIAPGTQLVDVPWNVSFVGPYSVSVNFACAQPFVGFLFAQLQAGSKTATGCTLIVANRHASLTIGAATFDVLAWPL